MVCGSRGPLAGPPIWKPLGIAYAAQGVGRNRCPGDHCAESRRPGQNWECSLAKRLVSYTAQKCGLAEANEDGREVSSS